MKRKNNVPALLLILLGLAVYLAVVPVLPIAHGVRFRLGLWFTLVAFGVQVLAWFIAFRQDKTVKSKVYGLPVAVISVGYLAAQLAASFLLMALDEQAPLWVSYAVYGVLLLGAVAGIVSTDAARTHAQQSETATKRTLSAMRTMQEMAARLPEQCADAQTKAQLAKLTEAFRYSDPVSNPATAGQEQSLRNSLGCLEQAVSDADWPAAQALCQSVLTELNQRNRMCKQGKTE